MRLLCPVLLLNVLNLFHVKAVGPAATPDLVLLAMIMIVLVSQSNELSAEMLNLASGLLLHRLHQTFALIDLLRPKQQLFLLFLDLRPQLLIPEPQVPHRTLTAAQLLQGLFHLRHYLGAHGGELEVGVFDDVLGVAVLFIELDVAGNILQFFLTQQGQYFLGVEVFADDLEFAAPFLVLFPLLLQFHLLLINGPLQLSLLQPAGALNLLDGLFQLFVFGMQLGQFLLKLFLGLFESFLSLEQLGFGHCCLVLGVLDLVLEVCHFETCPDFVGLD